ncbi:MAG TPA: class I SAM-dependent methyltransferase [Anaerolineae bacterium]|nr:class I SAM-dependent methyltransferase [Anaerolineae bacterium]
MKDYNETTYGDEIAEIYDEFYADYDPASIELLAELSAGGPALELGIGTGRIALPLHEKGVEVLGIDSSEAMVAKLRSKPNGSNIEVLIGSFGEFRMDRRFRLIYVVFNTFFGLQTQAEQVRCFQIVREHLESDGVFLMEAFVPDPCRFVDHQTVRTIDLAEERIRIEVSKIDPIAQQVTSQHTLISKDGIRFQPVRIRYAWPSELDLMAQIAGLSLRQRWSSWSQYEFGKQSQKHISIYGVDHS